MNRLIAFTLATLLLTAYISSAESAERPFQGESSGSFSEFAHGYEVFGQATHLGQCASQLGLRNSPEVFFRHVLEILRDNPNPVLRSSPTVIVAADGSSLQGTIRYDAFDAELLTATAVITITGGTGRFAEATGTIDVLLLFTGETLISCDVLMDGTLNY